MRLYTDVCMYLFGFVNNVILGEQIRGEKFELSHTLVECYIYTVRVNGTSDKFIFLTEIYKLINTSCS